MLITSSGLDLENALLVAACLEGAHKRCLDRKECPVSVCGRAPLRDVCVNNAGIAALDRRSIDRQV